MTPPHERAPDPDATALRAAWVRALAARLVRDGHAADDLAQDAWTAAVRAAPDDEPSFRNWIAAVLARITGKRARTDAARRARERSVARDERVEAADEIVARAETHRALVAAVLALDEPYRATMLLRWFDELSPSQIAERQRVPVRTVKTRLARGMDRLRERLDRDHRGDRAQWMAALAPIASAHTIPISVGALYVKSKILVAVCAVLVLGWFVVDASRAPRVAPVAGVGEVGTLATPTDDAARPTVAAPSPERAPTSPEVVASSTPIARDAARDLHGVVVDTRGIPIVGASVRAYVAPSATRGTARGRASSPAGPTAEASSDALGEFHLDVEPGSALDLAVEHAGYARCDLGMRHAGERVEVVLTRPARIHGRVTDDGGSPLAAARVEALVRLAPRSSRVVETDDDGRYAIEDLPADDFQLAVEAHGVVPSRTGPFRVDEAAAIERDFALRRGVVARGTVTDAATGLPLEGAWVSTSTYSVVNGARTDGSGRYELRGVDAEVPSLFGIHARMDGYATARGTGPLVDGEIRVDLALERGLRARGRVIDAYGRPLTDVDVDAIGTYASNTALDARSTRTAIDGTFELVGLRRDSAHDLRVQAAGRGARTYAFPDDESRLDVVEFGDLRLEEAGVITARAVDAHGTPLADWWVRVNGGNADEQRYSEMRRDVASRVSLRETRTDDRGRFAVGDLAGGQYVLNVSIKGSTAYGERTVRLEDGQRLDAGDVVIDVGRSIRGVVVDEDGIVIANVTVDAYREPERSKHTTYTLSDTRGRFTLRGLDDAPYRLEYRLDFDAPTTRERYAAGVVEGVRAGGDDVRLVLPNAVWLRGVVIGRDGKPAPAVAIDVRATTDDPEGWPIEQVQSDAGGRFALRVQPGVRYAVRAIEISAWNDAEPRVLGIAEIADVRAPSHEIELRLAPPR